MRARHLQLLAGITLAGALLRFLTLDVQSYWLDEVATVNIVRHGFGDMISAVSSGESTPPLFYIVAWLWSKLFGTGEVGLRSLSALLGTLTVPLAYVLGREYIGRTTGVIAAALTAFNPLLIWYSQEARSYALMVLLTGLSLWALKRVLDAPSAKRLGLWAAAAIAAIATHYYAGFLIGAEAAWLLLVTWRSGERTRAAVAVGGVALAAAALLPLALHQRSTGAAKFIGESGLAKRLVQIPKQFAVGYQGPAETALTIGAIALLTVALVGLLRADRLTRANGFLLAGFGVVTIVAPLLLAVLGSDYLIARNVLAAWLPLAVAASAGFARGPIGYVSATILCAIGVIVVIGVDTQERFQRDNWRGAAQFIGRVDQPRAVIVTPAAGAMPLRHYLPRAVATPAAGVDVKELVFVGLAERVPGEAAAPPRPPQVGASGFTETRRKQADTYTVVVEQSPTGTHVGREVGASSLDGKPALTLYQR